MGAGSTDPNPADTDPTVGVRAGLSPGPEALWYPRRGLDVLDYFRRRIRRAPPPGVAGAGARRAGPPGGWPASSESLRLDLRRRVEMRRVCRGCGTADRRDLDPASPRGDGPRDRSRLPG